MEERPWPDGIVARVEPRPLPARVGVRPWGTALNLLGCSPVTGVTGVLRRRTSVRRGGVRQGRSLDQAVVVHHKTIIWDKRCAMPDCHRHAHPYRALRPPPQIPMLGGTHSPIGTSTTKAREWEFHILVYHCLKRSKQATRSCSGLCIACQVLAGTHLDRPSEMWSIDIYQEKTLGT